MPWPFVPRIIEKFLDMANLQKHNDNYADIASALNDLAGPGRTTETVKGNADAINNRYTKSEVDSKDAAVAANAQAALDAHKISGDHDARYYTKSEMQTAGQALLHWDNITNKPNFADSRWKAPVADKATLDTMLTGNSDGDVRLVLADETVYQWDEELPGPNKWTPIGAIGNGLTSHSALKDLTNDDHPQYHTDARGDARYYRKDEIDTQMSGKVSQGGPLMADLDFAQYEAQNIVIHRAPTAPTNPVEGQLWYDTTNHQLMIYKGEVSGWVDVSGKGAVIKDEEFTALPGQTVFDITVGQYEIHTNAITVYKKNAEGKYEVVPESEYIESSSTSFTLTSPCVGGEVFYVKFFENSPEVINQSVKRDGTLQVNLNSDMLDGHHADYFATSADVADHETRLNVVESELEDGSLTSINLSRGLNIINASRDARLKNIRMQGRTLVNHAGRIGNFESQGSWYTNLSIDNTTSKFGASSGKIDNSAGTGVKGAGNTGHKMYLNGKKFLIGIWAKSASGSPTISVKIGAYKGGNLEFETGIISKAINNQWSFYYSKADFTGKTSDYYIVTNIVVESFGTPNDIVNFDGLVIYELSDAEYDALDSMTPEEVAAKYPYVDDVKHTNAVYAINPGRNLLPPFTEWTTNVSGNSKFTAIEPYKLQLNADANHQQHFVRINVKPNQDYTISIESGLIAVTNKDATANLVNPITGSATFNTGNCDVIRVYVGNWTSGAGTFTFTNPMLNIGATALPFEPQKSSYLFLPDCQLRSNVDGSVRDELYMDGNGQPRVVRRFREMVLDGSLAWVFNLDWSGYKEVKVQVSNAIGVSNYSTPQNSWFTKYDGKILQYADVQMAADRGVIWNDGYAYISIADTDSGWGENYTPTPEEIRAYFYGWTLRDMSGNIWNGGDPAWKRWYAKWSPGAVWSPGSENEYTKMSAPNFPAPGYTPYRLIYQLAQSVDEPVTYEGELMLHEGPNQIEAGTGVVVREKANPGIGSQTYTINNYSQGWEATRLSYRVAKYFAIYRDQRKDTKWTSLDIVTSGGYGGLIGSIPISEFDNTKSYSVTYIALDKYLLGLAPELIEGEYAPNIKETVDDIVRSMTEAKTALSVLTNTKAAKQQPQWIAPTLLNGWVNWDSTNMPAGYVKDELGFVHLRGFIKNGSLGVPAFYLPVGYRPNNENAQFLAYSNDGTNQIVGRIIVYRDGRVVPYGGSNWIYCLDSVSFRAEQ